MTNIVKVKYYSETTEELSSREYTYFSDEPLEVGDIIIVPVRDTVTKAQVSTIDVPDPEIEPFRDKVKTIPAGSLVLNKTIEQMEQEADESLIANEKQWEAEAEAELAEAESKEPVDYSHPAFSPDPNAWRIGEEEIRVEEPEGPVTDIQAASWYHEAIKLQEYAEKRAIKTVEDNHLANDDLTIISRLKKAMDDRRKELKKPHMDAAAAIEANYKVWMNPVLEADRITRAQMTTFLNEQKRIRQEQEEINRKRMEAAEAEMRLTGELSEPVNMVEVVEATSKVSTDMGGSGLRENWVYEITDFALLPDDYKIPNTSALNAIAKSIKDTRQIPGLRIYNNPGMVVRPR